MIWLGNVLILTLALVSKAHGRSILHLLQFFIFSDMLPEKDDGFWTDLDNLNIDLDFKEMRKLQEKLDGYERRLRPGYSSMIW